MRVFRAFLSVISMHWVLLVSFPSLSLTLLHVGLCLTAAFVICLHFCYPSCRLRLVTLITLVCVPSSPHAFCFNVCNDILYVFSPCTCGFGFVKTFTFSFVDLCHQLIKDCPIKPCCLLCLHFNPQLYTPYSWNNMQLVTSAYFITRGLKN